MNAEKINIAVSKGRILSESLPLLKRAGIAPKEDPSDSRKLVFATHQSNVQLIIIRAQDVPTYVRYGAADFGIAGKDVLLEEEDNGLYELLDLNISKCRIAVAEPEAVARADDPKSWTRLRIATKYPNLTRKHFAAKGIQTDIIKLYGSMELAPLVGLSDRIVDLVSSGQTLAANGLVEVERIADVSAWLVANRAAMKMKRQAMETVLRRLAGSMTNEDLVD